MELVAQAPDIELETRSSQVTDADENNDNTRRFALEVVNRI